MQMSRAGIVGAVLGVQTPSYGRLAARCQDALDPHTARRDHFVAWSERFREGLGTSQSFDPLPFG